MAYCKQPHRRLMGFSVFLLSAVLILAFLAADLGARVPVQRHFLSWESLNRPEQYRRLLKKSPPARRFKVSSNKIAKLKKSSFLNKRPYQFSTPLVEADKLYVGSDSGLFYAYNIPREKKIWKFKPDGPVHAKAAFADETVYFGDTKATIYALDAATGAEKWRSRLDSEVLATPLVIGNKLVVPDMSGRLYALDRSTGVEVWHTDPSDRSIGFSVRRAASPVEVNGLILLGSASGGLIAYHSADGSIAWVRQLGDKQSQVYDVDSTPLLAGGKIYVSSADGHLFCVEPSAGAVIWSAEAGGVDDLALHNGKIYASGEGVLSALEPESGNILWQQDLETPEISSPVADGNYVAVATTVDKLYLIDSENGDIVYERFLNNGSFSDPVISSGRLYLLTNTGRLYSYNIRELPPRKRR